MSYYTFTSESVSEGHPDKLCDQVSDAILDAFIKEDPNSRVAVETAASKDLLIVAGEIRSEASLDIEAIARKTCLNIGYDANHKGLDGANCRFISNIQQQSADIAQGVDEDDEEEDDYDENQEQDDEDEINLDEMDDDDEDDEDTIDLDELEDEED